MNIIPMQDPMNGSASSYISVYDLFGYDADGFSGITSLGSITFKDPDSGEDVDAEAYYVIDNAGGIWQLMIYPQDGDYYAAYQYIPTDLGFQFPYDPNWATLCSLNVADDGELFLTSYSTQGEGASRKESTTLYWLHYDEQASRFRTAIIGSFGDIAPVSVTEVHTNDSAADTQKTSIFEKALRPESLKTAKAQPISQMKAANKQTAGTLNSVSQPQSTGSTSAQRSTVTLDLTAIAPTASSIMEISYNTKELTLSSVTGAATLTTWYESVPGTIVFACAERSEAAVGELLGQLRFELAAGSSSSKVTIKTKQLNETSFAAGQEKIRTVVLGDSLSPILPAIISSGEKDCPSRSFRDLDTTKWYHEAIDTMLAALSELCADGSTLVFDYPDENFFDATEKRVQNTIMMAKAGGEPMQSAFSYKELEKLLEKHGFLIYELLTPDDIQRNVIHKAGADMKAFEHVNYCLAVRKN